MRTVADAMTTPPVIIEPSATMQTASAAMLEAGAHAAVITDRGRLRGLATADDIGRALAEGHDATETLVEAIAECDPLVVRPGDVLADVHQRMRAEARAVVPVVGPHDRPLGLLVDPEASE